MDNLQENTEATPSTSYRSRPRLWEEIIRGWEWVVFSWKTLGRVGSIKAIVTTLISTFILLIQRTWRQWEYERNNK